MKFTRDRIGIQLSSARECASAIIQTWHSKSIAVPLNPRLTPEQRNERLLSAGCITFISDKHEENTPIATSLFSDETPVSNIPTAYKGYDSDHISDIIFTSGSTGKAKGVVHSFSNHYFNALGSLDNISFCEEDYWLMSLPLYHVSGLSLLFRSHISGGQLIFPEGDNSLAECIIKNKMLTHISLIPTQLSSLLEDQKIIARLQSLKAILVGGAVFPPELRKQCARHNLCVYATYGSSEMSSQITTTKPNDAVKDIESSGQLLPYRELMISEDDEILVKGKTLFQGYLDGPTNYIPATDSQGWFHTGDTGYLKYDSLYVTGRKDTMFISGGENIHPEEIESALLSHLQISTAIVVPIDSKQFGQRPVAFITRVDIPSITDKEIKAYLKTKIESFKIPDHFFDYNNTETSLKPDRAALQKKAELLLSSFDAD